MRIDDPETVTSAPDGSSAEGQPRWRRDFPIDWPADEFRSRRQFTSFLLLTSLAFVVGHAWIVVLRVLRRRAPGFPALDVAGVDELAVGGVKVFEYPSAGEPCVLVRLAADRFVAYDRRCTHLSCPVIPRPQEGKLRCPCHEGLFSLATGEPLAGPPRRPLPRIALEVRGGRVWATGIVREGSRKAADS
jgi:Rieske Fe-S protein